MEKSNYDILMYSPAEDHLAMTYNMTNITTGKTNLHKTKASGKDFWRIGVLGRYEDGVLRISFKKNNKKLFRKADMRKALEGRLSSPRLAEKGGIVCSCNSPEEAQRIVKGVFEGWCKDEFGALVNTYFKIKSEVIGMLQANTTTKTKTVA